MATFERVRERELVERYGAEALEIPHLLARVPDKSAPVSPAGFPVVTEHFVTP